MSGAWMDSNAPGSGLSVTTISSSIPANYRMRSDLASHFGPRRVVETLPHAEEKEAADEAASAHHDRHRRCLYCSDSATNRTSPSALATSSRADFLPSFLSCSMRFCTSAAVATSS